jgi:hypothetical protein
MSRGLGVVVVVVVGFEAVFVVFCMVDCVGWGDLKKIYPSTLWGKMRGKFFKELPAL